MGGYAVVKVGRVQQEHFHLEAQKNVYGTNMRLEAEASLEPTSFQGRVSPLHPTSLRLSQL